MPEVECGFPGESNLLVQLGPTLQVRIGFDPDYRRGTGAIPNLTETNYPALVDTGANLSCIDSALAVVLDLPIVDREPVSGAHGSQELSVHLAQIHVPGLERTIVGRFHGVHLTQGNQPHLALIGRLFLHDLRMTYDGALGSVIISEQD